MDNSDSPNKLRISYTLSMKHKKRTDASDKSESSAINYPRPFSQSPNKSKTLNISQKLAKLQEELDSAELSLQLSQTHPKFCDRSEESIYKSYIENLIESIGLQDRQTGLCLSRGWFGFLSAMSRSEELKNESSDLKVAPVKEFMSKEVQVNEVQVVELTDNFDEYIGSLQSISKKVNKLQISQIVEKLNQLSSNLIPIEIPSRTESPEMDDIDLMETVKTIHNKLKKKMIPPPPPPPEPVAEKVSTASQTSISTEYFTSMESHKANIEEKEFIITDMSIRLRRFNEVQELLSYKAKENENLRRQLNDIAIEGCSYCKIKKEQLANTSSQLRQLQTTVNKGLGIERELEVTKKKLTESLNTISISNSKIQKLSTNLTQLTEKVEEVKTQKEKLVKKLQEEEKLREQVEVQLKKEVETNVKLQKVVQKYVPDMLNQTVTIKVPQELNCTISDSLSSLSQTPNQSFQKTPSIAPSQKSKSTSRTPTLPIRVTFSTPERQSRIKQYMNTLSHQTGENLLQSEESIQKTIKMQAIMKALNMTEQEYLTLSKKARIQLFECLYEHREKCGSNCEHLKRAMKIRNKQRGQLYPTKKFNIS